MQDLIIRDATIVDGSGAATQTGDIAVKDGVITGKASSHVTNMADL